MKISLNLGGWLVIERWITPHLFAGLSETLPGGQLPQTPADLRRTAEGQKRIAEHYKKYVTKADLVWLEAHAIRLVRLPFAPDILEDEAALARLDWFMKAASKHHIHVLLDCHTRAPRRRTTAVLVALVKRYHAAPNLWGIELLNEPRVTPLGIFRLKHYYRAAYKALTQQARQGTRIVFSDGFAPRRLNGTIHRPNPDFPVLMDCHFYHLFGAADKHRTLPQHYKKLVRIKRLITELQSTQPIIVGEWSAMLPFKLSKEDTEKFLRAQADTYAPATANFYWTYKTDAPGRWNYRDLVQTLSLP